MVAIESDRENERRTAGRDLATTLASASESAAVQQREAAPPSSSSARSSDAIASSRRCSASSALGRERATDGARAWCMALTTRRVVV
jgi:hypothetical protein